MSKTAPHERVAATLSLSQREIEVLRSLADGRPYKEVASELFISVGTLKNHVHRILRKTGTRKLLEAVSLARGLGLLDVQQAK